MIRTAPATLLLVGIGVLAGCGEPERKPDTGEAPDCAEGFLPDGGECVPEACGTGAWGQLEVDASTVYVDIEAAEGGDGSEAAPLRSIQAGVDLAGSRGGGLVAVAAGSYPETLELDTDHAGVRLAGRCRELVTLDASAAPESTPGIAVETMYGEVELSGVSVVDSPWVGIKIDSGEVRLADLAVQGSAYMGIVALRGSLTAPTTVEVEGCEIVENAVLGVMADEAGVTLTLRDSAVRDSTTDAAGDLGCGVQASGGAALAASGLVVSGNTSFGVSASGAGTVAELSDCVVTDTQEDSGFDYGWGVQVHSGASLTAEGCELTGNLMGVVVFGEDTRVQLRDCSVYDCPAGESGEQGHGLEILDGAWLSAEGCELVRSTGGGVMAHQPGTEVELYDCVVRDTLPDPDVGNGLGMFVVDGAVLSAEGCELERNSYSGISALGQGTQLSLRDCAIRDTLPDARGEFGGGLYLMEGATLLAEDCEISGSSSVGIGAGGEGTGLTLTGCVVRDTWPRGDGVAGCGIVLADGPTLIADDCEVSDNAFMGILAAGAGTAVTLRGSTVSGTTQVTGETGATAPGVVVMFGAELDAEGLCARDNEGPGLYTGASSRMGCSDCSLLDNHFAGAVVQSQGSLELSSSIITGTREGVDVGGGVGVYAAALGDSYSPSVSVSDCIISDQPVAGVYLSGAGRYTLMNNDISASTGVSHGPTTRCGDGVFATGVQAWDGAGGLLLQDNSIEDNQGAGLFLDDGWATLEGNIWDGNHLDLRVQGEACLSPRDDWVEAPVQEICAGWDQPSCSLAFSFELAAADITPARTVAQAGWLPERGPVMAPGSPAPTPVFRPGSGGP